MEMKAFPEFFEVHTIIKRGAPDKEGERERGKSRTVLECNEGVVV